MRCLRIVASPVSLGGGQVNTLWMNTQISNQLSRTHLTSPQNEASVCGMVWLADGVWLYWLGRVSLHIAFITLTVHFSRPNQKFQSRSDETPIYNWGGWFGFRRPRITTNHAWNNVNVQSFPTVVVWCLISRLSCWYFRPHFCTTNVLRTHDEKLLAHLRCARGNNKFVFAFIAETCVLPESVADMCILVKMSVQETKQMFGKSDKHQVVIQWNITVFKMVVVLRVWPPSSIGIVWTLWHYIT